jgi:hypothetical protein
MMATRPKAKPKPNDPKNTNKARFESFIESTWIFGVDESSQSFAHAFDKLAPGKRRKASTNGR